MKIAVGMSGGVDSAAAAMLLRDSGNDVTGITLKLIGISEEQNSIEDAAAICNQLGIPHIVADLREEFENSVINYFESEYIMGRTPNPCIRCNKYVKFGYMYDIARQYGCDLISTGHYADKIKRDGVWYIKSTGNRKDQSYMLWTLSQEQIEHTWFPVRDYDKSQIREMLYSRGIEIHDKPDSQDICFIPDGDYAAYLKEKRNLHDRPGNFVDISGKVLGKHRGYFNYTIGQRKGLGGGFPQPMFVLSINSEKNEVILGTAEQKMSDHCFCTNINIPGKHSTGDSFYADVKIRYSARPARAGIRITEENRAELYFDEPQSAITPGQSAVGYDSDGCVVFGGEID